VIDWVLTPDDYTEYGLVSKPYIDLCTSHGLQKGLSHKLRDMIVWL